MATPSGETQAVDWQTQLLELETFVDVAFLGYRNARDATDWIEVNRRAAEVLQDHPPFPEGDKLKDIKTTAERLVGFAKNEQTSGHPYLFGLATTRLWSIIEASTDGVVRERIRTRHFNGESKPLSRIRVRAVDFLTVPEDQQAELLLEELKQETGARVQAGVARFEALLTAVGLGGPVAPEPRKSLFECAQFRNVIVHRSGKVDRRFLDACPWIALSVGQVLPIQRNHFQTFLHSTYWYLLEIEARQQRAESDTVHPEIEEVQQLFLENVKNFNANRPSGL